MAAAQQSVGTRRPVEALIRVIRGYRVMLDADLASIYEIPTFRLNEAVKRNLERFPEDFMFQLTAEETEGLISHFAMSKGRGGRRTHPYAFTEHGVAMLASVLRSPRAVQMNILIVRAFVRMRELIAANHELAVRIERLEHGQDRTVSVIEEIVEDLDRLAGEVEQMKALPESPKRRIGFNVS